ncbi:unnamed protein product [Orchesella dallaii]|uniref:Uncharacterized protein n=1 Tax=Orchesella dallaii TaxID=48710 RepID=A0ABP1RH29_9HEXA
MTPAVHVVATPINDDSIWIKVGVGILCIIAVLLFICTITLLKGRKKNRRSEEYSVTLENFREEEEEIPQMNLNEFHNLHNNMPNGEDQQAAEEIQNADDEVAAEEDEGFDDDDDDYVPPLRRDETPPPPVIEVRRGARNRVQTVYFQATFKSQSHQ